MDEKYWPAFRIAGLNQVELNASATRNSLILHIPTPPATDGFNYPVSPLSAAAGAVVRHYIRDCAGPFRRIACLSRTLGD
jgi:hypothetical protein